MSGDRKLFIADLGLWFTDEYLPLLLFNQKKIK